MRVKYDVSGMHRKNFAKEIAKWLCLDVKYLGAPSFAYEIGALRLDPDGSLTINTEPDNMVIEPLLEHLEDEGYRRIDESPQEAESSGPETQAEKDTQELENAAQSENVALTVAMPRDSFKDDELMNLQKLVNAKGSLIKKALAVDDLPIEIDNKKVSFPWFSNKRDSDSAKAYTHFITAICDMARNQKRITVKEKTVDNEKYAFRCFLLRLGFIGNEFKTERKILLKNFTGSSAFKNYESHTAAEDSISK
ncbi:MAG: virulence protein [Acutalibacteraceae bacterium]